MSTWIPQSDTHPLLRKLKLLEEQKKALLAACKLLLGTCALNLEDQEPSDITIYKECKLLVEMIENHQEESEEETN